MSIDFNVDGLKRSILNLSQVRTQLETEVRAYSNPVKTLMKSRQSRMKRPSKYIRMSMWLDDRETDYVEEDNRIDRQSSEDNPPQQYRRARRIKLNWDPDEARGEENEKYSEKVVGPVITTFSSKSRRALRR